MSHMVRFTFRGKQDYWLFFELIVTVPKWEHPPCATVIGDGLTS